MKNLFFNMNGVIRITITLLLIVAGNISVAQHIRYIDKKKLAVIKEDTSKAFAMNPLPKKIYVEEQNYCNLLSDPKSAPNLPLVINKVSVEMVKNLKERYTGHLYSITGLNMIDKRLKYKLKICDKNNGKFRSEYLDQDGNIIKDPDLANK